MKLQEVFDVFNPRVRKRDGKEKKYKAFMQSNACLGLETLSGPPEVL